MKYIFSILILTSTFSAIAQNTIADTYWNAHQKAIIDHYKTFLSIPNVTRDTPNIRKNAAFIKQWMEELGIETKLLEGITPGVTPAVYGKVTVPGATRTIAFYAHYDGQPVNPKQWGAGLEPFTPVFITAPYERGGKIIQLPDTATRVPENWRISGRGSADDKAGVMTILHAYAALKEQKAKLTQNIVFFFEGEEEMGSTHIGEIFERNKSLLNADLWVISDGPRHVSGRKMVVFGVRGDVNMALTVYGPKRPLHSGNYGNWAPNPARMLVELLAGMKDENNRVTIKGFYDDVVPLTETEKKAIAAIPDIESTLKKDLGIVAPEGNGASFLELLSLPTLNINGISSGNTGAMAANIIPVKAEAALDLRLVLGNDLNRQVEKVKAHIRSRGYTILDHDPSDEERLKYEKIIKISVGDGYNAQRTPMDLPLAQFVIKAVQASSKEPIVLQPSAGGSLPLIVFEQKLGAKVLTVPVVNFDNNQHAENENVRIDYLREGIGTMVSIMSGN